ncbi:MAG: hypothetical protein O3B09_00885, partial [Proteobacteria bacterium]|nr:hypothetical protein [Pseudomonadota bacterium]
MNNDNLKIILEFGKKLHELDELNYYYRYTKHKAKHEIIEGVLQEERVRPYNNVEFDRGRKAYRMGKSNLINDLKRFNGPYRQVLFLSDEEEKRIWGMFDELLNISQNIASFSTNEKVQKSTTFLIQSIKNFLHSLDNNTQITSSKAKDKINCFFNGFVKINERFCHEFKINPY